MTNIENNKERLLKAFGATRVLSDEQFSFGQQDYEAELYLEVTTPEELVVGITTAREHDFPFHIIGNGFVPGDILSIPGLVIKNNCRKFAILSMRGKTEEGGPEQIFVSAESGVGLNQLIRFTIEEGLGGIELFLGESGTVGDALAQNLVYEKKQDYVTGHIFTLRLLTKENEVVEVTAEPFLYPLSQHIIEKKQVIPLSVVFHLTPADKQLLWKTGTEAAFERNQFDLMDPLKGNFIY